ncbi:MAG TPA: TRAM domain-containing protein [Vicinamibacterales bacterium]|jgi:23S rRNA (uracil1939-C5)-methyltransferase|nr:TRAM domain-containing protein [Vicinamibacterales bacterium]
MPLAAGALLPLSIEKPAAGGRMIARLDGQVVLVAGAIPGERVVARIERIAKGVAYAQTTAVEERSPDRRDGGADPLCGGCLYSHIAYARQLQVKADVIRDAFGRIARIELPGAVPVAASREDGYRMRARLHVRAGRIGFFREGTHELCDPRASHQLLPGTIDALDHAARKAEHDGDVDVSENIPATERSIAFEGRILDGGEYVHDALSIDGHEVLLRRHVLAFFQGNRYLLGSLVAHVVAQVETGARVVDLYAGTGLFSVPLAVAKRARVTAVEGDRAASGDLEWNARDAGVDAVRASVEHFTERLREKPDVIVADPPRTGLSREALAGILGTRAPKIVYVSCDVATLARDARRIVDAGYTVARADAFDMFPNTPHVETVIVFTK